MKINKERNKAMKNNSKGKSVLIEPIFNSHKICFDFSQKEEEENNKSKKHPNKNRNKNIKSLNFNSKKFRTKTTSAKKDRNILNNIDINNPEFSTEKGRNDDKFLSEFELLYNCIKKKRESYTHKIRSKSGRKEKNILINKNKNKYSLLLEKNILEQDSILGIIYENKQIKKKNEELTKQFEVIKREFEQIKKDNKDIKEELKEKTKYLKDIKLSMDIFSQELLKLQNIYKSDKSSSYTSNNLSKNITHYNTNANNSRKLLIDKDKQKLMLEINNNKSSNNNENKNMRINTKNINNITINTAIKESKHYETSINYNNNQKLKKFEKIHQLPLNNINNLIKKQNKERGNSLEVNNFQDTSKLINIETKDATEKENNENINEKWSSLLNIEKRKEKEKTLEINNNQNESIEEKDSIELSNISLADNLNINEEIYNIAVNKNKKKMGKLLDLKSEKIGKKLNEEERIKKLPKKLNFINDNFNEEFMKYYDKFSDSWRKEVDKMLKKGK
jgi:hypothetical protein